MSKIFSLIVWTLFGLKISDTQCGFKIFKKPYCNSIFKDAKINGWAYDVEILALAKQKNLKIIEFPVIFKPSHRNSKL